MIFLGGAPINLSRKELVRSAEQSDDRSSSERTHIFPDRHLSFENLLTGLFYRMIIMIRNIRNDPVSWAIRWSMVVKHLSFRTDTYLIEILSTRLFYRMIIMMRNIRNDMVRRAIRWSMVFKRTLISSKFFQPDSFTHGVNMGRKTRKGDFLERFGLWNVDSWLTSQQCVESWSPV